MKEILKALSELDSKWRSIAFNICKNKMLADDLVGIMYLKLNDTDKIFVGNKKDLEVNEINITYVWRTLYSIFINKTKSKIIKNEISLELFYNVQDIYIGEDIILDQRQKVHEALEKMDMWDREILYHTSENSLRDLQDLTGISVNTLFREKHKALAKLKLLL